MRCVRQMLTVLTIAMLLAIAASTGVEAQVADDVAALNKQAAQLYGQGKYKEAATMAEQAVALAQRVLGPSHPDTLSSVNNLAFFYQAQGRYSEAEPLYKRALAAFERALGPEHPSTLTSVNNLAGLYDAQGRYGEAEPLYKRALEASERALGKEHPNTLTIMNNLAALYQEQGRYGEAELLCRHVLKASERMLGPEHPDTLTSVNNLASLYDVQGRYREAEPLYRRALEASEQVLGKEHPDTLRNVDNLATLYQEQGRFGEAEPLFKRAIKGYERVLGREHPDTLKSVNNLAVLYQTQGRYSEAELLYRRTLEASERLLGKEHPDTLRALNNLATLYDNQGRSGEAEPLYRRLLAAAERVLGREHPKTLTTMNNLASLYQAQGRYGEAEPLFRRAFAARERVLGKEHPETLISLANLAALYDDQGRYSEAEPLYRRVLEARERALGREHPDTLASVNNLAALYFTLRDWVRAAQFWRRSTAANAARVQRGAQDAAQGLSGKKKREAERLSGEVLGLLKAVYRLAPEGRTPDAEASREMFQTAQWAQSSEAAQTLAQMAARGAGGDPALAALARERQDLVAEWQKRDGLRNAALGQAPDKRDTKAEAENNGRLTSIDARIAEIDKGLAAKFPDYAALASPAPLAVEDVQAQLRPDEALVLFLDTPEAPPTPEETFIWVVTKTDVRWVRSELGTPALTREVSALRCGLDAEAWSGRGAAQCVGLLDMPPDKAPKDGDLLPFDLARAHALYKALFGEAEDLLKGKSLMIVPSGPLTQLPFQVLVTAPPAGGDYKSAAWLARDHAITVLPAVSSLKALRRVARPSAAMKPMIGFGDPLLDGDQGDPKYGAYFKKRAALARENQSCPQTPARTPPQRLASLFGLHRGIAPMAVRGLADVEFLRAQLPLPETRDELCAVARDLGADPGEMRLGARATEREVKAVSASGALAQYRIVHFATHGVLAGQLDPKAEPGLILTPPETASEEDDGYLTASEIAALKLDADWVILSACNTAAGGATGAEALSGLARAFFYAQARALLVSHWEVDSAATVKLITGAVSEIARDKRVGRAEALRRAMLAMIDGGKPEEAHPAYWAPFVLVGEGAAAR